MRRVLGLLVVALLLWSLQVQPAAAACQPIISPTADYTMNIGTERCSLGTRVFVQVNVCNAPDGNTEAKFSNPLSVRHAGRPGGGWGTWSMPPNAESPTPWVGYNRTETLTVTMADGYQASTVGMEIEPNFFQVFPITVVFRDLANT